MLSVYRYKWEAIKATSIKAFLSLLYFDMHGGIAHHKSLKFWKAAVELREKSDVCEAFILNPERLLTTSIIDLDNLYMYLELAALREYSEYLAKKETALPLYMLQFCNYTEKDVETNRLLTIKGNSLYFNYEREK